MPELRVVTTQQQNSVLTGSIIISGISYTGSNGGRIADTSIHSNTESNLLWMDDKASSHCLKTRDIHRAEHSKSMDNTSLIHSFRYLYICDRPARRKFLLAGVGKFWLLHAGKHFNNSNCTVPGADTGFCEGGGQVFYRGA